MWYVIQVKSGEEHEIRTLFEAVRPADLSCECFIPLYEEVRRSAGRCRIYFRKLFPGYIFIETGEPDKAACVLRRIPEFTRLLGNTESDGSRIFIPVGEEDEEFMRTLFIDGLMHVSYVHMAGNGRIDRIVGPLYNYRNHISKLEMRHRMAIVEAEMFGKMRRVRFGLWTDEDPELPRVSRMLEASAGSGGPGILSGDISDVGSGSISASIDGVIRGMDIARLRGDILDASGVIDIGIYPGDEVVDETGIYGDMVFKVITVDPVHRTVISSFEMSGSSVRIELRADDVRRCR